MGALVLAELGRFSLVPAVILAAVWLGSFSPPPHPDRCRAASPLLDEVLPRRDLALASSSQARPTGVPGSVGRDPGTYVAAMAS